MSPQRRWTLGLACTAWVLAALAAWKLTTPLGDLYPRRREVARKVLRCSALIALAEPYISGSAPWENPGLEWILPVIVCMLAGIVAAGAWFIYVARLAERCGKRGMALEATFLACANVVVAVVALLPDPDASVDSLSAMFRAHLTPVGPIRNLFNLRQDAFYWSWPHVLILLGAVVPLWSAAVSLRLLLALRRAARISQGTARSVA
jgi:hypothetical protein